MSSLILIAFVLVVGLVLGIVEKREEDWSIGRMVRADIKAQRKRGDIVKGVSTRGY